MTPYTPKKLKAWRLLAMSLRALSRVLNLWPLVVLAAVILSPIGPHIRWQYTYEQRGPYRHYVACQYLGGQGVVHYVQPPGECPFITLIDRRRIH